MTPGVCHDVTYVNWLLLILGGLKALEVYSPDTKKWRQAHMQARHAIARVLLEADGVLSFDQNEDKEVYITLNREKILNEGLRAVGDFLNRINIYKATANVKDANALFEKYTGVPEEMLALRDIVISKKEPRSVFVQANTYIDEEGQVQIKHYDASPEGMIQSFLDRGYKI